MRTIASRRQSASSGRFVGRIAEQQLFRATLRELAALRKIADEDLGNDDLSYAQIFLVAAEGGMGKSTLLRRFVELAAENADGAEAQAILIDLERHGTVADTDTFLRLLHDDLAAAGFREQLGPYRHALSQRAEARRKASDAEEQLRTRLLGPTERPREPTEQELRAFVEQRLAPEELRLADDPEAIAEDFMAALNRVAAPARPLVLLVDTYELADRCDRWLRQRVLPLSGPRLVWVLAGRQGQPFVRRYEDEFGAGLARGILLDTFARPDIMAFLRQSGVAAPGDELVDQLQALSRGVPLALEGWLNLHQKGVELPPPDPAAPTTRRAIVQRLTDRFLRYCNDDDRHLPPAERERRTATRNHILALMLLRHTDVAALAAAWLCDVAQVEAILEELADQFSFVFAQEIERQPHALVKEILREWLRDQPALSAALQAYAERLAAHFAHRMGERERSLWGLEPAQALAPAERAALERERQTHRQTLDQLRLKIAAYTAIDAPVAVLNQRDEAQAAIERIDARLAEAEHNQEGPRRPLWQDDAWREALLSRVNALCWADRSGERALRLLLPLWVEALEFHPPDASELLEVAREFAQIWPQDRRRLVEAGERLATLDALLVISDRLRLTTLQRAIAQIRRGNLLLKDDSLEEDERRAGALQAAEEAARMLPEDGGEVAVSVGELYANLGSEFLWREQNDATASPEAEQALSAAVRYVQTNQIAWYNLGAAKGKLKQHTAALEAFQQALALDPKDANTYHGLGIVYRNLGQHAAALEAFQQAIALDPKDAYPHNGLGNVYRDLGQNAAALEAFQQAIALDPKYAYPHRGLGVLYRNLGQHAAALEAFQQAIALDPKYADAHYGLGNVYRDLGQHAAALEAFQQAIALDPKDADPHYGLGNVYSLLGHIDEARDAYQRAVELDPEAYGSMAGLARLERQAGNSEQATSWAARVRQLLPEGNYYDLACLESIAGNVDVALDALRLALERREASLVWTQQDPDLDFIRDDPRFQALIGEGEAPDEKP
jgi:superkiller protein 3